MSASTHPDDGPGPDHVPAPADVPSPDDVPAAEGLRPSGQLAPAGRMPSTGRLGLARARYEVRLFLRNKQAVGFTFAFPIMLLLLFGSIFKGTVVHGSVTFAQVLVPGIIAAGIASVTFVNLAISVATERDEGAIKRLAGTPLPPIAYFIGKIGLVLVTAVGETVILLAVGVAFYSVHLPTSVGPWLTFAWVFVAGLAACTLLGLAMSTVPTSAKSAAAVVNLPFVALEFISGVFVVFSDIPTGLQTVASVFPLKWVAQGFRSVFLPRSYLAMEPAHSWEHGRTALVLGAWCVLGLALCVRTFRWAGDRHR